MMPPPEQPVVVGDPIEEWYHQYFDHLVRLGYLSCGDLVSSEDAVQEVFADLYRRPKQLHAGTDPLPYLRVSVLNRCRSRLRRHATGERVTLRLVGDARPTEHVEHDAVHRTTTGPIAEAVRSLPDRQREVMILRYWAELSEGEIAEALGISAGTVESASSRARTSLAARLEELR